MRAFGGRVMSRRDRSPVGLNAHEQRARGRLRRRVGAAAPDQPSNWIGASLMEMGIFHREFTNGHKTGKAATQPCVSPTNREARWAGRGKIDAIVSGNALRPLPTQGFVADGALDNLSTF